MRVLIIDCETTNAEENAEVIEAAWIDQETGQEYCERFLPEGPISFGAMATHHIMLHDLAGCRPAAEFALPAAEYLIGHNVDFDWRVMGSPAAKRICTLALCRHLWPELDSHKQGAVMYFLFGVDAQEIVKGAHNALEDVRMCQAILHACVGELAQRGVPVDTWQQIWQASEIARVPTVMTFGKHKGLPIAEVPRDYMQWYLRQIETDEYVRKAFLDVMQR